MSKREFGLVKSFDIDHGELDGLSPQDCFVLGYELASIDETVKRPEGFEKPVHSANGARIEKSLKDADRKFSLTYSADDVSESWLWLRVEER